MKNQGTLPFVILFLLSVACVCPPPDSRQSIEKTPTPKSEANSPISNVPSTPRTPQVEEIELVSSKWKKGGFGSIAIWIITVKNNTSTPIGDIKFKTEYYSETGNLVDQGGTAGVLGKDTIQKIVPPKKARTFEVNDGFVHSEAVRGNFEVVSWRKLE